MRFFLRGCTLPGILLLFAVFLPRDLVAQEVDACRLAVVEAEERYRDGDFQEVQRLLTPCLDASALQGEAAIPGYRILALASLQLGDIAAARRAVLRVFAHDLDYRADPIQDPPSYQALVETVRRQLDDPAFTQELERMRQEVVVPVEPEPRPTSYSSAGSISMQASVGIASYGGERGRVRSSALAEFSANSGPAIGLAADYHVADFLALGLHYDLARFPTVHANKSAFPFIDPDDSSDWLHVIGGHVVARFLPNHAATPYLRGGVGAGFIRINGSTSTSMSLDFALGGEFSLSRIIGIQLEMAARYAFPGDAIDLVDRSFDFDVLPIIRTGLVWKLGRVH